jgi:hypothetical protein
VIAVMQNYTAVNPVCEPSPHGTPASVVRQLPYDKPAGIAVMTYSGAQSAPHNMLN